MRYEFIGSYVVSNLYFMRGVNGSGWGGFILGSHNFIIFLDQIRLNLDQKILIYI
jgi:hypothetical protein